MKSLSFKLAKYDIFGKFYGFEDLNNQLFLCQTPQNVLTQLLSIGTTLKNECSFDLSKLVSKTEQPNNVNMFYEMFLVDYNGDLIDVPVKINQLKDISN